MIPVWSLSAISDDDHSFKQTLVHQTCIIEKRTFRNCLNKKKGEIEHNYKSYMNNSNVSQFSFHDIKMVQTQNEFYISGINHARLNSILHLFSYFSVCGTLWSEWWTYSGVSGI